MIDTKQTNKCTGCGSCAAICPHECISMLPDEWGFLCPQVNNEQCSHCGLCVKICPINNSSAQDEIQIAYAAYHTDKSIRNNSSSGGVFTAISEEIIRRNGVVFGAKFNEDMVVHHSFTETSEALSSFRGSKYVQSDLGDSYQMVKAFLQTGRPVLFTGTPCQITGLYAYLGKKYNNLFCQDVICHGVPSPTVWKQYLKEQQKKYKSTVKAVSFRDKKHGWNRYSLRINFQKDKIYSNIASQDPFIKSFLKNYCLRPSCYQCAFKQEQRLADITLADFWGIDQVAPEMNDDLGTSLVLIHSTKGLNLLKSVATQLKYKEVDWEKAIAPNPAINTSVSVPKNKDKFLQAVLKKGVHWSVKKYCCPTLLDRVKTICYKIYATIRHT